MALPAQLHPSAALAPYCLKNVDAAGGKGEVQQEEGVQAQKMNARTVSEELRSRRGWRETEESIQRGYG